MVLLTANRYEVFNRLAERPKGASDLAAECGANPRSFEMLLNACVAHKLLQKKDGLFSNTEVTAAFMVRGRPAYLGDALRYATDLFPIWGQLPEAVKTGRPQLDPEKILGTDPAKTRNFILGMHNRAEGIAASLACALDLNGYKRMLDVGGGSGTYSIKLVQKTPGLTSAVMDFPAVTAIAQEIIAGYKLSDRVSTVVGNYHDERYPTGNDVVLMSGMMHREVPEVCRALLRKANAAMDSGGMVVVVDVFCDDDSHVTPAFATLFALNMMLTSENGSAHAITEMADWMLQTGFKDVQVRPLPMSHSVIFARK